MKALELTNKRFGRTVALNYIPGTNPRMWLCLCDCGTLHKAIAGNLGKHVNSCGCIKREELARRAAANATHGKTGTPEWVVWQRMVMRCHNPKNNGYKWYGAVGVSVCEEWRGRDGFANFLRDMGPRPTNKHQLGRKMDTGNYNPQNCEWQTRMEQGENRRDQRWLEFNGERLRIKEWAARIGMSRRTLLGRILKGWTVEDAITKPLDKRFQVFRNREG